MHNQNLTQSPTKTVSPRRSRRKIPKEHLSIKAYHKLNRSHAVSNLIGNDLIHSELGGLKQLYIHHIFSYLNEDIGFVLAELKEKGLCADFQPPESL
ncbi:Derepression protein [Yersinia ruckeri]|uniref:Derepression protein n=1 Tax=Yersinia ruckeri TaxID=29486 RepID=UPI0022383E6A|nr:Derepression protein [Yersinia ruckeri]MCW6542989.1 Derepression protein [Yersinia ruckeri]MCW6591429.1 Derepression protein [Yersinia ruckeri]UZX90864.1 Derepression protein [Yersinia ruckeri]